VRPLCRDVGTRSNPGPVRVSRAAQFPAALQHRADAADRVEAAVRKVLQQGFRTADIFAPEMRKVGTEEMGDAVVAALRA